MSANHRRDIDRLIRLRQLYDNSKASYPIYEYNNKKKAEKVAALITGGIGDFLAIEPFILQPDQKVEVIYLATRGHNEIGRLLRATYPKIILKNALPYFPTDRYCFITLSEVVDFLQKRSVQVPQNLSSGFDYSISRIFPQIENSTLRFSQSSYINNTIADVKKFNLPSNFCAVVTASTRDTNSANSGRNLSNDEIQNIVETIKIPKICVFCLCKNPHPGMKHLKGISVLESIEIIKKASCYAGVDSCLSVIVGFCMKGSSIAIKSINDHLYNHRTCYYPLLQNSSFLHRDLLHDLGNLAPS